MDPNLQAALKEIEEVIRKHDCAAMVFLASKTHTMYLHAVSPSWSCAKMEGENKLRIKALAKDYPSAEEHKQVLTNTIGMILGFAHTARLTEEQLMSIATQIGKLIEIEHWDQRET